MQTGRCFRRQFGDLFAGMIHDLERGRPRFVRERVIDLRSRRRVLAEELALGAGEHALASLLHAPADHAVGLVQVHVVLEHRRRHLPERRHVQHPEAAAVGRGHQLAGSWMLGEFMDRDRRQVIVQLRPRDAAVGRHPGSELGADVEKVRVLDILAADARRANG